MRVVRGRGATIEADRALTAELRDHVAEHGGPAVRVWRPHQQVAFGRRDSGALGYDRARRLAREQGYTPVGRSVGGRAVAYQGTTVAFARVEPVEDPRTGLQDRYEAATDALDAALETVGVESASAGEPDDAFCPGSHSLSVGDGKIVGIAQRVTTDAALVAGVAIPRDRWPIAEVLDDVYDALEVSFDPCTVGSVQAAGGDGDPEALVTAIEDALVGQHEPEIERVEGA
ncbi:biotin/lipoate A/B protein ligase family protein [Salinarchaeum chitinilyticum]